MNKMKKAELRLKYKLLRSHLSANDVDLMSLQIANQLVSLAIWNKTYYHLFLSIKNHKEVETEFILHILQGKDKEIVLAKSNFDTIEMQHFLLTDNTTIIENKLDIPEPQNGLEVPVDQLDVVFVPLLAFDIHGNRVGFGKGFYDKFLSKCKPETIKIGLSFFEAELQIEGLFEEDIQLNYCVTPSKIYQFDSRY